MKRLTSNLLIIALICGLAGCGTTAKSEILTGNQASAMTETTAVTEAAAVTETTAVTEAAAVTETAAVPETPVVSASPVTTKRPTVSENPTTSATPTPTGFPVVSATPTATKPPVVSATPVITEAPSMTEAPVLTETPATTKAPAAATPLPQPDDEDLVRVIDYIPTIRQDLPYATANNFTGQRIYDFTDAYLRYGTVKKLAGVCADLADYGLGLKIWDGYRPLSTQQLLWDICPEETYVSNPATGYRAHCRGNAVDVTLVDLDSGDGVVVPSGFDNFTALGDRDYSDCSPTTIFYMTILEELMIRYGFEPYEKEWWHFTDTDDYPLEENFDPAIPGLWAANCQKQMGMFKSLGNATASKRIPAGDTMEFISWRSKYAKVSYRGTIGYVMSSYIKPADDAYLDNNLDIVTPTDIYSYEQMLEDISLLRAAYSDIITVDSIGTSEFGVDIPVILIGDKDAEYHILFQGSIHGREHMTTWLLMAMTDYWLSHDIMSYGDVCYHIIPMCNPDGVQISQSRTLNEEQLKIYKNDVRDKRTNNSRADYAALWKANGQGIDLNRNFPCGWMSLDGRTGPSSQNYEGETPFSTAEACALRDYTLSYEFDSTISYHATGSMIFYTYGKKQPVNKLSKDLAKAVQKLTGYDLGGVKETDGAGYKDWAMDELGIPSLTIEVGCQDTPLAQRELYSVFIRNYRVMPTVARWVQNQ